MKWPHRRNVLVCRDAVELMASYLDGRLSQHDADRLAEHLGDCSPCTEYLNQLRATIELSGRVTPPPLDADTEQALGSTAPGVARSRGPQGSRAESGCA